MKNVLFTIILSIISSFVFSQILYVSHDVSGDYQSIDDAMNAAGMNDTIVIRPGTYTELLWVQDKGLTFGSMYLLDPDPEYIRQTVLDGENRMGFFFMQELVYPVEICGLTMINGAGTKRDDLYITSFGGAINAWYCDSLHVKSCHIAHCHALIGGGILTSHTKLFISGTSIHNNYTAWHGGGLSATGAIYFDTVNLCSIYNNYAGSIGCDISFISDNPMIIKLDTASTTIKDPYFVISPGEHSIPTFDFTYRANVATITPIAHNLYVAPWGDNDNSGLSPDDPFKTITHALLRFVSDDSVARYSIFLDEGIYSPETTGDMFPIQLKANMKLIGKGRDKTIITQDTAMFFMHCFGGKNNIVISDLSIRNSIDPDATSVPIYIDYGDSILLENISIIDLKFESSAALAAYDSKNVHLKNILIKDCTGTVAINGGSNVLDGKTHHIYENIQISNLQKSHLVDVDGAIAFSLGGSEMPSYDIINSAFDHIIGQNNYWKFPYIGGFRNGNINFFNCTFGDNSSTSVGGIDLRDNVNLGIYNSIFYNNYHPILVLFSFDPFNPPAPSTVTIENTLFQRGNAAIVDKYPFSGYNIINYSPTNIDEDPMWLNTGEYPYSLLPESPCIDAGSMDYYDSIPLPDYDLAGNPRVWGETIDMGAYEYQGVNPFAPTSEQMPCNIYPNPFSHEIAIEIPLQNQSEVNIEIFSIHGQKIANPLSGEYPAGLFTTYWNGFDGSNKQVPDGVYIIRITINDSFLDFKVVKGDA